MSYQFRGYMPLMQNSSIISLEHLTFWKLSCTSCVLWFIWWYLYRYRTVLKEKRAQILSQRLQEFNPEPLFKVEKISTDDGIESSIINIQDIDLASNDFLSVRHEKQIKQAAQATISKYGVGSCGPRAFYGTADLHLQLEDALGKWLSIGDEESHAILYSYQQCTISSAVAAFCTQETLCFIDEQCSQSMWHGLKLKRVQNIIEFKHNCAESLKSKLHQYLYKKKDKQNDLQRCFLMVEGLYYTTGQILNLDLLKLARQNKIRVILDESLSLGTLGKNGKGIADYYNLDSRLEFVDITIGSLEHALHSTGGFALGRKRCCLEQQLLSAGYLFSASLPVFSAKSVLTCLDVIKHKNFDSLLDLSNEVHTFLVSLNGFTVCSSKDSPLKVVLIAKNIELFYEYCKAKGVYMIFKKGAVEIDNVFMDALYLQLKLEFLDYNRAKMERLYKVLKDAYEKI